MFGIDHRTYFCSMENEQIHRTFCVLCFPAFLFLLNDDLMGGFVRYLLSKQMFVVEQLHSTAWPKMKYRLYLWQVFRVLKCLGFSIFEIFFSFSDIFLSYLMKFPQFHQFNFSYWPAEETDLLDCYFKN